MSKMNSAIVASYGFTGKYNSLVMSASKVVAVGLSAFSIVSAMVNLSLTSSPGNIGLAIESGFAGVLLAILIEGITLVCLALIRGQYLKGHRSVDEAVKKQCKTLIIWLAPFAGFGIIMSATAGDLFWYQLLAAEPLWKTIAMSIAFALVVSFCFLLSELFAVLIEIDMVEGMNKGQELRKAAFAAEHADTQLVLMRESYQELLHDKGERDAIKQDLKGKLKVGLLAGIAQINIEHIVNQAPANSSISGPDTDEFPMIEERTSATDVPNVSVKPGSSKTLQFNKNTAEIVALEYSKMVSAGERPTQTAIAKRLGLSRPTVAPHFHAIESSNVKGV